MTRPELIQLQEFLSNECIRRRGLGDYSTEASGILNALEVELKIVSHLVEITPADKK